MLKRSLGIAMICIVTILPGEAAAWGAFSHGEDGYAYVVDNSDEFNAKLDAQYDCQVLRQKCETVTFKNQCLIVAKSVRTGGYSWMLTRDPIADLPILVYNCNVSFRYDCVVAVRACDGS